jgi:hypothetical protein
MMKLKLGLNLNTILFILFVVTFSVILWFILKFTHVTEGLTVNEAKQNYDDANTILQKLNQDLEIIVSNNLRENVKYLSDKAVASNKIASQNIIVKTRKLSLSKQVTIINSIGISPNVIEMKKQYNDSNNLLTQLKNRLETIESDHKAAIDKYNKDKSAKEADINNQQQLVNTALNTYNELQPPIINSATAGDAKVILSISPIAGTIPDSYTVTYKTTTKTLTPVSNGNYTIDGLTNGTSYTFSVIANYKNGNKSNAATSKSVTPISKSFIPRSTLVIPQSTPTTSVTPSSKLVKPRSTPRSRFGR